MPDVNRDDTSAVQQPVTEQPSTGRERVVGRVATLILVPSSVAVPLGPAWAVLCGVITAAGWRWQADSLLSLIVVAFVTEILWSSWRAQVVDAGWEEWTRAHPLPRKGAPMPVLPYTKPHSPLGRSLYYAGRLRRWIREVLPAERRGALIATFVLPPLILLLSTLVSVEMLVLSVAALALVILEWRVAVRGGEHNALRAALEIGLSWMAGHLVIAPLTPLSLVLASCYATAYQGILGAEEMRAPDGRLNRRPFAFLISGQLAAGLIVLLTGREAPRLGALAQASLIIPQLLLLAGASLPGQGQPYARRAAAFLMLAMPLAAWAA
jgi:hypothetical protein